MTAAELRRALNLKSLAAYALMLAATVGLFLLIRQLGHEIHAPDGDPAAVARPAATVSGHSQLFHVLLALAAVIAAGRSLGVLFKYVHQPPVIGEVLAGILLGPSLLGRIAPDAAGFILPQSVAPALGMLAQVGVILYMFIVGLELDTATLRHRGHSTIAISHASIVVPFVLGAALALGIYARVSTSQVPFTAFALFLGVSMSVTAFPVLARILSDLRMSRTRLGVVALACAAVDDATAWCLLALVVGITQAAVNENAIADAARSVVLTLVYIVLMVAVVRPFLLKVIPKIEREGLSQGVVAVVFLGVLFSSLTTEYIGVHAIFGAFLLGAIIPHDSLIAREFGHKLSDLVSVLLLPAFFAFTGMRTQIGLVSGWEQWIVCIVIILVATAGKFGGTLAASRITGLGWRDSLALGAMMNTRGLMGLIVLNVGLDLGVISPTLFAMMVLMALVTTLATAPFLVRLRVPRDEDELPLRESEQAAMARERESVGANG